MNWLAYRGVCPRTNQIVAFEYVSRTTEIGTDQITSLGYACMTQSVRVSEYRSSCQSCLKLGWWGNPPNRGRKIKRVYMQSYNPGVLGWGFLRLLLRLQLRSLSRGVPSSHLEKDERLILGHVCIYSWKRHALCYAVLGYARNRWLNTLYGIVWETKYGRFTTLNIPKCEHFTLTYLGSPTSM